ncbi:MAG: helix-turn-helix domain-containing protein [Rhodobacterales bacterium]|nr:helix-turn-helix domain-containing protein [Rhodobacterales bacterium]
MSHNALAIAYPRPTAQVEPFVTVMGFDLAIAFLLQFGGVETYFRKNPREDSDIVRLNGLDKAKVMGTIGESLPRRIPSAKPWIAAYLAARGADVKSIALTLKVSDTTVRKYMKARGG